MSNTKKIETIIAMAANLTKTLNKASNNPKTYGAWRYLADKFTGIKRATSDDVDTAKTMLIACAAADGLSQTDLNNAKQEVM